MKKIWILWAFGASLWLAGCSQPLEGLISGRKTAVTGVTVDKTWLSIEVGQTKALTAAVEPENAADKTLSWTNTAGGVVRVNEEGGVTALKPGTAVVIVRTADGGYTASCTVTVTPIPVAVSGLSLEKTTLTLYPGDKETLSALLTPQDATDKTLTWESDNEEAATVDAAGQVTAVAEGTAAITVRAAGGAYRADCTVTVRPHPIPVTGVRLNKTALTLAVNETETLTAGVEPADATNQTVTWTSNNPAVASVDDAGQVTAGAAGTAVITATALDGRHTAACAVTVPIAVGGLSLNTDTLTLSAGGTAILVATVTPANAADKTVIWASDNESVATVDNTGLVTAVAAGTAVITAATLDGGKTAACIVTVTIAVSGISLDLTDLPLVQGDTATLTATVTPADATNQTVIWTSSDTATARVDAAGQVTAIAEGRAVITATALDGGKTAACAVTVRPVAVTGISLNTNTLALYPGNTATLTATVAPDNAANKNVTWTSSDPAAASVNNAGQVTAVAAGTAVIIARTDDGGYMALCTVTVRPVPVTGITGVPARGMPGVNLPLSGTVAPANATYQAILWSVKSAGTTGAAINGNTLRTTAEGTAVVTATIANGTAIGTAYTQDFGITIGFTTPAQYREMVLATPNAVNTVTITGDSAYYYSSSQYYYKGVFIENRTVILSPFRIAKYETTYELWYEAYTWATHTDRGGNRYTFANAGREGHDGTDGAAPTSGAKLEPVTYINWRDAVVWCNAYSEMEGKEPVYYTDTGYTTVLRTSTNNYEIDTAADTAVMKPGANGYRLPTEAEWEYAARGGKTPSTSGSFVYTYAGSDTIGDVAWYSSNSDNSTHAVGGKAGNTLGLYDMSGNVFEWCWDWYSGSVGTGTVPDPTGAASGSNRVLRGGAWYGLASDCMVALRYYRYFPFLRDDRLGFRVVAP